jgi:tetratricopeptide (TPR) repeat protein
MQVDPVAAVLGFVGIVVAIAAFAHQVRHGLISTRRGLQVPSHAEQQIAPSHNVTSTANPDGRDMNVSSVRVGQARGSTASDVATLMTLRAPTGRLAEVRGRGELLDGLVGRLAHPDGHFVVLAGLGGAGKTTVALALAERAQAESRRVWWVSAVDNAAATGCLLGLALELGAPSGEVEEAQAGLRNPAEVLWARLEDQSGWLLVVDNVDDVDVMGVAGAAVGDGTGWLRSTRAGLVVVTSRVADKTVWGRHSVVHIVGCLGEADGARVLMDLAPHAGSAQEAAALSARLGGLPLALRHAGSYLASPFVGERLFIAYADALDDRFPRLLGQGADARSTVTRTWEISLDALAASGRLQARPLLRVLACFAPSAEISPLLLDPTILDRVCMGTGEDGVRTGLEALLSMALIETRSSPGDPHRPGVVVHPLVAGVSRLHVDTEVTATAATLVEAATRRIGGDQPHEWPAWLDLLPHLRALLGLAPAVLDEIGLAAVGVAATRACHMLNRSGAFTAAADLASLSLRHTDSLGAEHDVVLSLRHQHGRALAYQGQVTKAVAELRDLVGVQVRVLGPDHPATLATRHELAWAMRDHHGHSKTEIERELRDVLAARLRVLGPDHPDTLATRFRLACAIDMQGRWAEAEGEYRNVLDVQLRTLGPDHPDTLNTRNEIIDALIEQGRYAEAEAAGHDLAQSRLRVLGPDHPDTLATRAYLAWAISERGRYAEAELLFRDLLDDWLRVVGPDHMRTLDTRYEIADAIGQQGRYAEAEAQFQDVLNDLLRLFGPDHSYALYCRREIAHLISAQGRHAQAHDELRDLLDDQTRVFGPTHPRTLWGRYEFACTIAALGRHAEAEAQFSAVQAALMRAVDPDHPYTLATRRELAQAIAAQGGHAEAHAQLRDVLDGQTRVLGADHPHTLQTQQALLALARQTTQPGTDQ